jgi:hypothetical protein
MEEQSRAHEFAPGGINDPLDDVDDNDATRAQAEAED